MTQAMPTIALMMDNFLTVYQTTLRDAVQFEAQNRGANILCIIGRALDSPFAHERVQNQIFHTVNPNQVQGIVLSGTTLSVHTGTERIDDFCREFTLPMCNIGLQLSSIPSIVLNNHQFRTIVEHLVTNHHCKRVAYIGGPKANEEAHSRREAFIEGLKRCKTPFFPELETVGRFTLQSGSDAAARLLDSGAPFDALVAANDNMALGAIQTLKARGLRIPQDVCVTGFDDTLTARFHSPPLTTMRQPIEIMGRLALDLVLRQIQGETVPLITEVDPVFYPRQSCGCNFENIYQLRKYPQDNLSLQEALKADKSKLAQTLEASIQIPTDLFDNWIDRVLTTLEREFSGETGRLLNLFEEMLDSGGWRRWLLDELQSMVSLLKGRFPNSQNKNEVVDPEVLWHGIQVFLCNASAKEQMQQNVDADLAYTLFLNRSAATSETLSVSALAKAISKELMSIGIANAAVMLQKNEHDPFDILVAIKNGSNLNIDKLKCASSELLPSFLTPNSPKSYVIAPLSSGEKLLGRMVLELGAPDLYYEMLREHLSTSLTNISSHQIEMKRLKASEDAQRQELELEHRQKLEGLGLLAGSVAHDFNNVLSVILGNMDVALLDADDSGAMHDILLECKAVAKHSAKLCGQLLTYASLADRALKRLNLNQTIHGLEDLLMVSVQNRAKMVLDLNEGIFDIEGDVAKINQLLISLIIITSEAMESTGETIRIRTRHISASIEETSPQRDLVLLEIIASGISQSGLEQINHPNAAKELLDQASIQQIVAAHDGHIHIRRDKKRRAHIEITFPALPKISDVPILTDPIPIHYKGEGTILLLDNEPGVLRMGERLLKRLGFEAILAKGLEQALRVCHNQSDAIRCVIIERNERCENEVAAIRNICPKVPVIFTSAFSKTEQFDSCKKSGPTATLQKPYDLAQLSASLEAVLCI